MMTTGENTRALTVAETPPTSANVERMAIAMGTSRRLCRDAVDGGHRGLHIGHVGLADVRQTSCMLYVELHDVGHRTPIGLAGTPTGRSDSMAQRRGRTRAHHAPTSHSATVQ